MSDINYKAPRKKYFDGNSKAFINFKISVWFRSLYSLREYLSQRSTACINFVAKVLFAKATLVC